MNKKVFKLLNSIKFFREEDWNKCNTDGNIFLSYNFLLLLEESNSVSNETGWIPNYFAIFENDVLVTCAACYVKMHSQGEYVFDHSWANAYASCGLNYYPKLLIASPFTPVSGLRILIRPESDSKNKDVLINQIIKHCKINSYSGLHINFFDKRELSFYQKHNLLIRLGEQFHFLNANYTCFRDFLDTLSYKNRKRILKERASIKKNNIEIKIYEKNDVTRELCEKMYEFYLLTIKKKWSYNYLTKDFFLELSNYLKSNVLLIMAIENNEIIAGALNFISDGNLYGRYWGATKEVPNLHFEVCFYQAIEYAIRKKLGKVEAGAQGLHKVKRGYLPVKTYSAHLLFNEKLSKAIKNFLVEERKVVEEDINLIENKLSPFKN